MTKLPWKPKIRFQVQGTMAWLKADVSGMTVGEFETFKEWYYSNRSEGLMVEVLTVADEWVEL